MDDSAIHTCSHCRGLVLDFQQSNSNFWARILRRSGEMTIQTESRVKDIINGASSGCSLCADILLEATTYETIEADQKIAIQLFSEDSVGISHIMFVVERLSTRKIHEQKSWQWVSLRRYQVYTLEGDPANERARRRLPNLDPASEASFIAARGWLKICRETHSRCYPPRFKEMPTRLLNLKPGKGENESSVSLIDVSKRVKYVALSYCWGGDQPFKTTRATLKEAFLAIDVAKLPKTIQDAIRVTQELDIQFLWVDSLCIVQDDAEDVSREIGKMPEIYRGAIVTISAASASSSNGGFLHRRIATPSSIPHFKIPFRSSNGDPGTILLIPNKTDHTHPEIVDPIDYRAWTLQEHILSSRILCYSSQQLHWICQKERFSDGGRDLKSREGGHLDRLKSAYTLGKTIREAVLWPDGCWDEIVEGFSCRALSVPSDKLIAISAIAKEFSRLKRTKYVAGLWENSLVKDLLWQSRSGNLPRPKDYRAPSWSWASIDGEIHPSHSVVRPQGITLELLRWEVQPVSRNSPYSAVTSAHIEVRGRMIEARLTDDGKSLLNPSMDGDQELKNLWQLTRFYSDAVEVEIIQVSVIDVWLLDVYRKDLKDRVIGLVLIPHGDGNRFKRVGLFSCEADVFQKSLRQTIFIV